MLGDTNVKETPSHVGVKRRFDNGVAFSRAHFKISVCFRVALGFSSVIVSRCRKRLENPDDSKPRHLLDTDTMKVHGEWRVCVAFPQPREAALWDPAVDDSSF